MRKTAKDIKDPYLMGYNDDKKVAIYYGDTPYQQMQSVNSDVLIYKWQWHNGSCVTLNNKILYGEMQFKNYNIFFTNQYGCYGISIYKTFKNKTYIHGFRNKGSIKFMTTCTDEIESDEIIKVLNCDTADDGYIIKKFLNDCKKCYENDSKMYWD